MALVVSPWWPPVVKCFFECSLSVCMSCFGVSLCLCILSLYSSVVRAFYIFWVIVLYQIHVLQIFFPWLWLAYSFSQWWWFSCSVVSTLYNAMDCSQPSRLLCPWDSPGKNTGVGCHFLFQGIFPTQGLNLGLLYCRWSPASQVNSLPTELPGKLQIFLMIYHFSDQKFLILMKSHLLFFCFMVLFSVKNILLHQVMEIFFLPAGVSLMSVNHP